MREGEGGRGGEIGGCGWAKDEIKERDDKIK